MLYYTVTDNVSDIGSELAFNTATNKAILNGASYEESYYISVCAINAIGKETIYIIASSLGATVLFILLLVIVPILALVCSKGIMYYLY